MMNDMKKEVYNLQSTVYSKCKDFFRLSSVNCPLSTAPRGFTPSVDFGERPSVRARSASPKLTAGFTLIETFVAITILITAIVGPLTIASQGLSSAMLASDQTVALFLSQDSIEYVRWVRDTNELSGASWLTNLAVCTSVDGSQKCLLDSSQPASNITACTNNVCPIMNYDSSSGFYNYTTGSPSKFTRTVSIISPISGNANEAGVIATVSWQSGSLTHSITVRENMFNVYGQ